MTIYLSIKQHSITKLKYFCKTICNDPYSYKGSGHYWRRHLKIHGRTYVETLETFFFEDQSEATAFALMFSEYNDIVKSKLWANEKPENALDGGFEHINNNPILKENNRISAIKRFKNKTYEEVYGEEKAKELRNSRSESNRKRGPRSEETKQKIRTKNLGRPNPHLGYPGCGKHLQIEHKTCPYCNITTNLGNYARWHGNKCKNYSFLL